MRATVITDASWCPKTYASGFGIWITYSNRQGKQTFKSQGSFKDKPENPFIAELWASINGIDMAIKRHNKIILLQTDCLTVVDMINQNHPTFWDLFNSLKNTDGVKIKAKHVKGHSKLEASRFYVNRHCDKQAKFYMRKQRKEFQKINNNLT